MNMPQYAAHQIAMAYSMQCAYPHEGIEAATFGYMEPQYAQQGYTPNYNYKEIIFLNMMLRVFLSGCTSFPREAFSLTFPPFACRFLRVKDSGKGGARKAPPTGAHRRRNGHPSWVSPVGRTPAMGP